MLEGFQGSSSNSGCLVPDALSQGGESAQLVHAHSPLSPLRSLATTGVRATCQCSKEKKTSRRPLSRPPWRAFRRERRFRKDLEGRRRREPSAESGSCVRSLSEDVLINSRSQDARVSKREGSRHTTPSRALPERSGNTRGPARGEEALCAAYAIATYARRRVGFVKETDPPPQSVRQS